MRHKVLPAAVLCVCVSAPAVAQTVLTLETTIARAREQAGSVLVARARIAEAEAALVDASARYRTNPVLEFNAGPRLTEPGTVLDLDLGMSQQLDSGALRDARVAAARAVIERERATADEAGRLATFEAASAFLDAVAARERLRVAEAVDGVARELVAATERRYAVGDIAALDLNHARIEASRSAALLAGARAAVVEADGLLRSLLRLPAAEPLEPRGTLELPAPPPLTQARVALEQRPDLTALLAESRAAGAETDLGRALGRPELGVRLGYHREDSDTIVLGGLTVTLPAFQRGQGALAAGLARSSRAKIELETARARAGAQLEAAYGSYQQHAALVTAFASSALPSVEDNELLARRSYEAGELGLLDYLTIRRDALQVRTAVIDRRLEAAHRRVTIDFIAGVLR